MYLYVLMDVRAYLLTRLSVSHHELRQLEKNEVCNSRQQTGGGDPSCRQAAMGDGDQAGLKWPSVSILVQTARQSAGMRSSMMR